MRRFNEGSLQRRGLHFTSGFSNLSGRYRSTFPTFHQLLDQLMSENQLKNTHNNVLIGCQR